MERPHAPFKGFRRHESCRIEAFVSICSGENEVEQGGGGTADRVEFHEIDARCRLTDGHTGKRAAQDAPGNFLREVVEKRRDIGLLRRLVPPFFRDREKDQNPVQRYAAIKSELIRPFVDPDDA
ncbi:hypothetical protein [Neorhizobium alkalisoli]|uniref:hypothetical protein n=1 Tax=Neorhizobium alkalisoli TaxID=528178 RepID=UPI001FDEFF30|nr:hypothetical protein [Neorhizobium alkalisoli]